MRRYGEQILHVLLDKYENSLLYKGENTRNQTISYLVKKSTLPEYFDETSEEYAIIHAQLLDLEEKGFLSLKWKNGKEGHILERCILRTERVEQIYPFLHRRSRREKEERLLAVCQEFSGNHPTLDRFLTELHRRLEQGEPIRQLADPEHPKELEECCRLILQILNNQNEIFLREFSIRYCNDSKTVEREMGRAAGIIAQFDQRGNLKGLTAEQVLEEYNIYRNPSWVLVKGKGSLRIGSKESLLRLEELRDGIGLSGRDIGEISWEHGDEPRRVVTIENLTSFHRWQEKGTLAVYLGGYHNQVKRRFLKEIYRAYPQASYGHFGDLDCGGFQIWKDLRMKTGIPFEARYMDAETYLKYQAYGKELTEHDRKELIRMLQDPFFEGQWKLFERMLESGVKLEQECILISS